MFRGMTQIKKQESKDSNVGGVTDNIINISGIRCFIEYKVHAGIIHATVSNSKNPNKFFIKLQPLDMKGTNLNPKKELERLYFDTVGNGSKKLRLLKSYSKHTPPNFLLKIKGHPFKKANCMIIAHQKIAEEDESRFKTMQEGNDGDSDANSVLTKTYTIEIRDPAYTNNNDDHKSMGSQSKTDT